MSTMLLAQTAEGVTVRLKAIPGARINQLQRRDDELRVLVTQTPERGKANRAIIALLADTLGVAKSRIEVIQGATGRRKTILFRGYQLADIQQRLFG
jgi:hypothetical protein